MQLMEQGSQVKCGHTIDNGKHYPSDLSLSPQFSEISWLHFLCVPPHTLIYSNLKPLSQVTFACSCKGNMGRERVWFQK